MVSWGHTLQSCLASCQLVCYRFWKTPGSTVRLAGKVTLWISFYAQNITLCSAVCHLNLCCKKKSLVLVSINSLYRWSKGQGCYEAMAGYWYISLIHFFISFIKTTFMYLLRHVCSGTDSSLVSAAEPGVRVSSWSASYENHHGHGSDFPDSVYRFLHQGIQK